jgi:hypothetical protein
MPNQSARMCRQGVQTTHTDNDLPRSPCISESQRTEGHGSPTTPGDGFRHDSNSHTRLHHATYSVHSAKLNPQLRRAAKTRGLPREMLGQRAARF